MRCATPRCQDVGSRPIDVTHNVHEMLCAACMRAWLTSPDFGLALQLVAEDRPGDAISQYRNWTSTRSRVVAQETRRAA